jgi:5'-nucleotidase/UDP-sugar diphosphatase
MKKYLKAFSLLLVIILVLSVNITAGFGEKKGKSITILFTHDLHDHFLPIEVEQQGKSVELGGYARLLGTINEEKKKDPEALLVDAGDFSMGTLFQAIFASDSPELRIMGQMGYDVTTLGNHEFDFRPRGLTGALNQAKKSGEKLPQIVASNVIFPTDKNGSLTKSLNDLKTAMNNYGVLDYTILNRKGLKIGIFGLMGKDAASNAPMSEVKFADTVDSAKKIVDILKQKEKVDLIICLSHAGTWTDKSKSEDEILAKKVPDINVIISGHTHTKLQEPIIVGNTIIGSCGEYGENLGVINISTDPKKGFKLDSYKLKQIDDSAPEDANISQTIENYKKIVQDKFLNNYDMKFDEKLANSSFNFVSTPDIGAKHGEDTLGDLISDSYIYAVKKAEGAAYEPIAAAIEPTGTMRGSFVKGGITVSDAFTVSSLGIGPDNISGYPLISAYLTGKELKTACEVDASISPIMSTAQLYMSGLSFTFNPNRLLFNKVTEVKLQKPDGTFEKLNNTKLYRVVVGLYSAQMLSVVGKKSFGLLSIVPKTKDGKPITDFEDQIIIDKTSGHNNEVKEWLAIAEYLRSFNKVKGVPEVPQYYNETHGRKMVDNNHNIIAIIANPNGIALAVYFIVILIIAIIVFIIYLVVTRKKRREKRNKKKHDWK